MTTIPVTNITQTSALAGVTLTDDGGAEITAMGFCWSTSPNPTINSYRMNIGTAIGSFTHVLNGLTANTKYYVRAYAVNTGNLCPLGWHVPTNTEWNSLIYHLGVDAGGKMKETGNIKWVNPNTGANNISGFTAIPGGSRDPLYQEWRYSTFGYLGYNCSWWPATEYSNPNVG